MDERLRKQLDFALEVDKEKIICCLWWVVTILLIGYR